MKTYRIRLGVRIPFLPNAAVIVLRRVPENVESKLTTGIAAIKQYGGRDAERIVYEATLEKN